MVRKNNKTTPKPKTPWQFKRKEIDSRMRVALCLHVICGYPQTKAYEIAFEFKGKASSLAPLASRYFNLHSVNRELENMIIYYDVNGLYGSFYRALEIRQASNFKY